ncbi:MAG: lamin tail domain-containing protein [Candidatus Yanofskybacteria bacterium]|nr:lamin tail domain-containing protein [Candidatus Yanofskybacteria bacterium]
MTPVKSVLMGISAGALVYFVAPHIGGVVGRSGGATIGEPVAPVVSQGAKAVPSGAKRGATVVPSGATNLAPAVTPGATGVMQVAVVSPTMTPIVTPRIATSTPTPSNTPSPTPSPSRPPVTPAPTPTPTLTPTPSPTLSPTPSFTPPPTPSPLPTSPSVVINEIAWAGTSANASDEWFELYNAGSVDVPLDGWKLADGQGRTIIALSGAISSGGFYLVERTDDTVVSDISAHLFGPFGGSGFVNAGRDIVLQNADGVVIDSVICGGGWFAGDLGLKASMERISVASDGGDPTNWATNNGQVTVGVDANGAPIRGTPAYRNSVAVQ